MLRVMVLILLIVSSAEAAVSTYNYRVVSSTSGTRIPQLFVCDTEAERPTIFVADGDLAYTKDTDLMWLRSAGAWVDITSSGGGGAPTTTKYIVAQDDAGLSADIFPSADDQIPVSSSTSAVTWKSVPDCDLGFNALTYDITTNTFTCFDITHPLMRTVVHSDVSDADPDIVGKVILADGFSWVTTVLQDCNDTTGKLDYDSATNTFVCNTDQTGGAAHDLLSATHTDTTAASPFRGDLIVGGTGTVWKRFAGNISTTTKFLSSTGSGAIALDPVWGTILDADIPDTISINLASQANSFVTNGSNCTVAGEFPKGVDASGNAESCTPTGGGPAIPSGTGFRHITTGTEDATAKLVDTADINNSQITYAKIQNIGAERLLGNPSGVAGPPVEIDLQSPLMFVGGTTLGLPDPPTGTGFRHMSLGVEDATAKLVTTADIGTLLLPVTKGGTGAAPASDDQVLISDTASTATWKSIPDCNDSTGHMNYDTTANLFSCGSHVTFTGGGVSGTLAIANGGTGQTTAQTAINALTAVSGATNEHILTKDTATGNAIFKAAPAGGSLFTDGGSWIYPTVADNLKVGNATAPIYLPAGGKSVSVVGNTAYGVLEMSTNEADTDGAVLGGIQFSDKNAAALDERAGFIFATQQGATAGDRGAKLFVMTKANAGTLQTALTIDNTQTATFSLPIVAPNIPVVLVSTGAPTDAVIATYTAIPSITFTPLANTRYRMSCFIIYTSSAATTGINFAWDVPAAVTSIHMTGYTTTTALGANEGFIQRADNVGTPTTAAIITTQQVAYLEAQLSNGANATATTLGFTPETANSVAVIAGSTCQVWRY